MDICVIAAKKPRLRTFLNPIGMALHILAHRRLIQQFAVREVAARFRGSVFGILWAILTPLAQLAVYTFVFAVVFRIRFGEDSTTTDFVLNLFCGLVIYGIFADSLSRAPNLIINNVNFVKKVVFPLESLPVASLLGSFMLGLMSMLILLVATVIAGGQFPWRIVALPAVLAPLLLFTLGLSWLLASLGVFVRDVGHMIAILLQLLFYLTPILYPIERVPQRYQVLMRLNPLACFVEACRSVTLNGEWPMWHWLAISTLTSLVVAVLGYAWFMKTKHGFADVL